MSPGSRSSASSGTVANPLVDVSTVAVSINAQGLAMAPGSYYCLIQVSADNASNSPDSALVVLDILPPGSNPGPNVQPSGLVFTTAAGASDQGSKTVLVANRDCRQCDFRIGRWRTIPTLVRGSRSCP